MPLASSVCLTADYMDNLTLSLGQSTNGGNLCSLEESCLIKPSALFRAGNKQTSQCLATRYQSSDVDSTDSAPDWLW